MIAEAILDRKAISSIFIAVLLLLSVTAMAAVPANATSGPEGKGKGFNEFGYNYKAKLFNGPFDGADKIWDDKYWGSAVDVTSSIYFADDVKTNFEYTEDTEILVPVPGTRLLMGWSYIIGESGEGDWITNLFRWSDENGQHKVFFRIENVGTGPLWGAWEITHVSISNTEGVVLN